MNSRFRRRPKWLDLLGLGRDRRAEITKWRWSGLTCVFLITCLYLHVNNHDSSSDTHSSTSYHHASRHLLSTTNATTTTTAAPHGPVWERCDFETSTSSGAWVFSHSVCVIIIFIALAIICDDFFVPSLEIISEKLNLSEDVAGATFMAAGSSAPELFSSVAGVAVQSDVGVGTIVGSAVFNLLIIIALTAALAGQVLHLDWRPLMRDAFFYAMSIGCFIGFAWDGYFMHYEAVILLILYGLYITLMVFNPRLMDWMATWSCVCRQKVEPSDAENLKDVESKGKDESRNIGNGSAKKPLGDVDEEKANGKANGDAKKENGEEKKDSESGDEGGDETMSICPCLPCCPLVRTHPPSAQVAKEEGGAWNWFKLVIRWVLFVPAFPFVVLFSWTVPDCGKEHLKKYYLVSFLMSVFWIAVLSFGMVTLVMRVGCILNVDSYIMGLVIVAVGTSIPDALSSILVARDGYGDMAVSNAIGSNVFDINLGLGLPFVIRIAIDKGDPISLLDDEEWADLLLGVMTLVPHAKFGFILLIILVIALTLFGIVKFRLNKWIGISFVVMYFLFLAYAFTQELYCVRTINTYC